MSERQPGCLCFLRRSQLRGQVKGSTSTGVAVGAGQVSSGARQNVTAPPTNGEPQPGRVDVCISAAATGPAAAAADSVNHVWPARAAPAAGAGAPHSAILPAPVICPLAGASSSAASPPPSVFVARAPPLQAVDSVCEHRPSIPSLNGAGSLPSTAAATAVTSTAAADIPAAETAVSGRADAAADASTAANGAAATPPVDTGVADTAGTATNCSVDAAAAADTTTAPVNPVAAVTHRHHHHLHHHQGEEQEEEEEEQEQEEARALSTTSHASTAYFSAGGWSQFGEDGVWLGGSAAVLHRLRSAEYLVETAAGGAVAEGAAVARTAAVAAAGPDSDLDLGRPQPGAESLEQNASHDHRLERWDPQAHQQLPPPCAPQRLQIDHNLPALDGPAAAVAPGGDDAGRAAALTASADGSSALAPGAAPPPPPPPAGPRMLPGGGVPAAPLPPPEGSSPSIALVIGAQKPGETLKGPQAALAAAFDGITTGRRHELQREGDLGVRASGVDGDGTVGDLDNDAGSAVAAHVDAGADAGGAPLRGTEPAAAAAAAAGAGAFSASPSSRDAVMDQVADLYGLQGRPCKACQALLQFCKTSGVAPESAAADLRARGVPDAAALTKVVQGVSNGLADLASDEGWELVRNDELQLLYRNLPGTSVHAFRARCVLDHPVEQPLSLAREVDLCPTWNKYCTSASVLREMSVTDVVVYMSLWVPWPFNNVGFMLEANGADLYDEEGRLIICFQSPSAGRDATGPDAPPAPPPGSEKHSRVRLLAPSCMSFTPLPPKSPGGPTRTAAALQVYVDPGVRHVPHFIITFVLKVLSPFIYGSVKKVLASAFKSPNNPLPKRIAQRSELYDLVRRRTEAFLRSKAAGASAAAAAGVAASDALLGGRPGVRRG